MGDAGRRGTTDERYRFLPGPQRVGGNMLRWFRRRLYRWRGTGFGIRDALVWFDTVDLWYRYAQVRQALGERLSRNVKILEVGPGWFGLEFFLPDDFDSTGLLVQVDVRRRPIGYVRGSVRRLLASGSALPFRNKTFDYVVAVDVLEHIPREQRGDFSQELTRVARGSVLLHMPLQSADGSFQALNCDRFLRDWMLGSKGKEDHFLREHLELGHPSPEEVEGYFPGSSLSPTQSVRDWKLYMVQERAPTTSLLAGVRSYLQGFTDEPPFYSGLFVWTRT